jgi:hypothetical protein
MMSEMVDGVVAAVEGAKQSWQSEPASAEQWDAPAEHPARDAIESFTLTGAMMDAALWQLWAVKPEDGVKYRYLSEEMKRCMECHAPSRA